MSNVSLTAKVLGWVELTVNEMSVLLVLIVTEEFITVRKLGTITIIFRRPRAYLFAHSSKDSSITIKHR